MSDDDDHSDITAVSRSTQILDREPSCIEFSRVFSNIFIIGTYHLDTETTAEDASTAPQARRTGQLLVFELVQESTVTSLGTHHIEGAVLDLHFSPHDHEILAVAQSDGAASLWRLYSSDSAIQLDHVKNLQLCAPSDLILSLAWSPEDNSLAVTVSDGKLIVTELSRDWSVESSCYVQSQSLEAWTLAWSTPSQNTPALQRRAVYCGGDDAIICRWHVNSLAARSGDEQLESERFLAEEVPAQRLKGTAPYSCDGLLFDTSLHTAGVTAILTFDTASETIVTGSYDEYIRVIAPTPRGRWRLLAERRLDGGVWRLKLLERRNGTLTVLASCMHAGTRVLLLRSDAAGEWSIELIKQFEEHESMNYGSDAARSVEGGFVVISTSFYDRRLCVWSV